MLKHISLLAAIAIALISSTALIGWISNHTALAIWIPGIANMTVNTALCFFLLATTCLLPTTILNTYYHTVRSIMIGLVVFIAATSLMQDIFAINTGIDSLFFNAQPFYPYSSHAGRMSPMTSVDFLFSCTIFIMLNYRNRQSSLTHALILILCMLSILAIGMNIFMQDIPASYSHLASISLFTAISFLLLSIVFFKQFQQQYQIHRDTILHSAISLMYHLKYPQKFILISLIVFIPLGLLTHQQINLHQQKINQAKLKLIGLQHIKKTNALLIAIPEHRGLNNAFLNNQKYTQFAQRLQAKSILIDQLFKDNARLDQQQQQAISIPNNWQDTLSLWKNIKLQPLDKEDLWFLHTEIIQRLIKHLRDIGQETMLSYDADPTVHNLLAVQLSVMPALLEELGQLRGLGVGFMVKKHISYAEQLKLTAINSQITLRMHEAKQLFEQAHIMQTHNKLHTTSVKFFNSSKIFMATANQELIKTAVFSISPEDYFQFGTSSIELGKQLNLASSQIITELLEQRINTNITAQYNIKLMIMSIALILLLLFAAFYQSVMNTIHALSQSSMKMRQGDSHHLEDIQTHDEMHHIVGSFNSIAKELINATSQVKAVIDHAVDGIITINNQGKINSFNPAAESIFQYTADEVMMQDICMLMPEEYRDKHQAGLQHYLNTGESIVTGKSIEVQGLRNNGESFPMELSIANMLIEGEKMFVGTVRDLTHHKDLESQLRHAQKMEAVGALVGGVAHNFNNLLAGIIGKTYLAKRKAQHQPDVLTYLESIENISSQAADMIKKLMTFAHKDFFTDKKDCDLSQLIQEAFQTASLGMPENIEVSLSTTAKPLIIHADANQIQQVLMNMMNNARDALKNTPDKRINVDLNIIQPDADFFKKHTHLEQGSYTCLSITDNGHGMDAVTISKIFDPFYSTKIVGEGTGLGLSSAFGCIQSHHGVIEVHSELEIGTRFQVYLPIQKAKQEELTAAKPQVSSPSSQHEGILLIDDEPIIRDSLQEVLEELGYQVFTAHHGLEGIEQFNKHAHHIHLILTDVIMPKMNGIEMFRHIHADHPHLATIFMTGYDQGDIQLTEHEKNYSKIIPKPVKIPELSILIQELIQQSKQHS